jgi:hypothetical protein
MSPYGGRFAGGGPVRILPVAVQWTTSPNRKCRTWPRLSPRCATEAREAGVFVFSGGLDYDVESVVVATAGKPPMSSLLSGYGSSVMVVDVYPLRRRPWSGPQRSRSPAAVRKRSACSGPPRRLVERSHADAVAGRARPRLIRRGLDIPRWRARARSRRGPSRASERGKHPGPAEVP